MSCTIRRFLAENTLTREAVDRFLDPDAHNWAGFDPVLGYTRRNSVSRDGVGGGYALCTHGGHGERARIHYADDPCRINSYGDSFTYGDQVSDAETWQEYLAAQSGEPIRNFGVGSYGVYQAYLRMLREEATGVAAEYVIFGIYDDDHARSIYPWRALHMSAHFWPGVRGAVDSPECFEFHANPWAYLRFDSQSGGFDECENEYDTPESLYKLCDPEYVYETFRGNFDVQVNLAMQMATDVDVEILRAHAEALSVPIDLSTPEAMADSAKQLLTTCSLRASMYVLDLIRDFADREDKQVMLLLTFTLGTVADACGGVARFDQPFIDYVRSEGMRTVDMLEAHVRDFQAFRCTPREYVERYYYGHYAPAGNHFQAFTLLNPLREWLDPPPPTFRDGGDLVKARAGIVDGRRAPAQYTSSQIR